MPCARVHSEVGMLVGGFVAFNEAAAEPLEAQILEAIGGGLGGRLGGLLPDLLEPAISSWHRGTAHSFTAAALLVDRRDAIRRAVEWCRNQSRACTTRMTAAPESSMALQLWAFLWLVIAGFLTGLAAGYVSHLALDALTPRGLPLI